MKSAKYVLAMCLPLSMAPAFAEDTEWVDAGGVQHMCAGVGETSRAELEQAAGEADARIVLSAGPYNAYLNDVEVKISGGKLGQGSSFTASGPICLIKVPAGNYRVNAQYEGTQRNATLNVAPGQKKQVVLNFPTE